MGLTNSEIRKALCTGEVQILPDTPYLSLRVPAGSSGAPVARAAWRCRVTRQGKEKKVVIGHWPQMSIELARRERDRLTGQNTDIDLTVTEAVDDYRQLVTDLQTSGYQSEVYLRHLVGQHGHRRIATMTRAEVVAMVKRYAKDRGRRSADRYFSQLRGVFNLCVEQGLLEVSPLLGVSSRITGYVPAPRERVLTPGEIRELWSWDHPNAALLRFLLLTGLRISEAQKGYREGDRWVVPAHHSKNKKSHWVHLTITAKKQLLSPFDVSPTAVQAWVRRKLPVGDKWTPHDLRRTACTLMNENGVEPFIVERVIGHTLQGVMAVYNRAQYEDTRVEAARVLEHVVLEIVREGYPTKIIKLA